MRFGVLNRKTTQRNCTALLLSSSSVPPLESSTTSHLKSMQALSIKTDFPSNQGGVDFSILPSPSTFFLSSLNNFQTQSPTYDQYPHSATDYHSHFKQEEQIEQDYSILPSLSSQESSVNGRSPSPASSFPSTPSGSPIPGHLQIEPVAIKGEHDMLSMHNKVRYLTVFILSIPLFFSFRPPFAPPRGHRLKLS